MSPLNFTLSPPPSPRPDTIYTTVPFYKIQRWRKNLFVHSAPPSHQISAIRYSLRTQSLKKLLIAFLPRAPAHPFSIYTYSILLSASFCMSASTPVLCLPFACFTYPLPPYTFSLRLILPFCLSHPVHSFHSVFLFYCLTLFFFFFFFFSTLSINIISTFVSLTFWGAFFTPKNGGEPILFYLIKYNSWCHTLLKYYNNLSMHKVKQNKKKNDKCKTKTQTWLKYNLHKIVYFSSIYIRNSLNSPFLMQIFVAILVSFFFVFFLP